MTSRSKGHSSLEGKTDFLLPATHYKVIHLRWVCCFCLAKMPDSCCSIGCSNRRGDKPGLCFFRISSDKENPEEEIVDLFCFFDQILIFLFKFSTKTKKLDKTHNTWHNTQRLRICAIKHNVTSVSVEGKQLQPSKYTHLQRTLHQISSKVKQVYTGLLIIVFLSIKHIYVIGFM